MPDQPTDNHKYQPDASFDGADLDCGNGLLLLIRKHIDPLEQGQLLEILSSESSVEEDLPAWCRLTNNELVSFTRHGQQRSFLVCKGRFDAEKLRTRKLSPISRGKALQPKPIIIPDSLPAPSPAPEVKPLSVMGIGSWPRSGWMLRSLSDYLEGRLSRQEFDATADDAVRLAVQAQLEADVDVVTDGEQRRDNYASFVGSALDNCQLVPLTDLFPLVEDAETFKKELQSLDVPAEKVRHPVVFGPLGLSSSLALRDANLVRSLTDKPIKIALPGPYLLSRIMWLDCIVDKAYSSREALAKDIVRVLREETHALLAAGVSIVQFDEPVLSEVVFTGRTNDRSFMCGALSGGGEQAAELQFATDLINQVVEGLPAHRLAIHICRGNWTPDESVALEGGYEPLLPLLSDVRVGTLFLEYCTERAGQLDVLREIPSTMRIGVGVVNPKQQLEDEDSIRKRIEQAISLMGVDRILLNPDCGFATFADNPVASQALALEKLRRLASVAHDLRLKFSG